MDGSSPAALDLASFLRDVPDFPRPGVVFKDITPLLGNPEAFGAAVERLTEAARPYQPTHVAGIESRGFLFAAPLARELGLPLIPLRKPGKLPWKTWSESYELEYGQDSLEIHHDACGPGHRVVLVDDLIATGGSAEAAVRLLRRTGAEAVAALFVVELAFLEGARKLHGIGLHSLVRIGR